MFGHSSARPCSGRPTIRTQRTSVSTTARVLSWRTACVSTSRPSAFRVEAQVLEYVPPAEGKPGRLGWHGWGGEGDTRFAMYHPWLIENLPGGRVGILPQESQEG